MIMLTYLPQLHDLKIDYAWGGYVAVQGHHGQSPAAFGAIEGPNAIP